MSRLTIAEHHSPASARYDDLGASIVRAIYGVSPNGILVVGADGTVLSNNRKFLEVWNIPEPPGSNGLLRGSDEQILQAVLDRVSDPDAFLKRVQELYAHPEITDQSEVTLKDGRTLERNSSAVRGEDGGHIGRVWFFRDLTERKEMEQQLRRSEERFRGVAEAAQDAVIVVDSVGTVQYWNAAAERILGYSAEEALGKVVHQWLAPPRYHRAAEAAWGRFLESCEGTGLCQVRELEAIRKDGSEIPVELSVAPMKLGSDWCAVGILRDVSSRKQHEQRIAWLARNDVLTELPNRSVFAEEVREALLHCRRSGKPFAVLYLDLDHFKDVNDTLGHATGDLLLKGVAERVRGALRAGDRVARFGGDEFAVLTTELRDKGDASVLAMKLLAALSQPFSLNGYEVHSSATIGIAISDEAEADAGVLLSHADVALYRAKTEGRGTFRFFTSAMDEEVRQRVALLRELREAIDKHELFLVYQPQVNIETGETVGLEALVRWRQQSRIVPASRFIDAAEGGGLIIALGQFVLAQACRQVRRWLDAGLKVPLVAVNVSPAQFKASSDLGVEIAGILHETGIPAGMLEIELTESALMQTSRDNVDVLRHVRQQGVRIAIDDFGTGYSCLDYLRRFPTSRIKVAQTFIADLAHDPGKSGAIVRAAIGLGRELGLGVIAEGVETADQVALLRQWDCREAQGFYFAPPLSVEEVPAFLNRTPSHAGRPPVLLPRDLPLPCSAV